MPVSFNHLTIAVRDLARALAFYSDVVGLRVEASWARGAYLTAGATWICLAVDADAETSPPPEYTHFAFGCSAEEFAAISARINASGAGTWKQNASEGQSLYFLDPDGHKLELHVGDLQTRLDSCRRQPYEGMSFRATADTLVDHIGPLTVHIERTPREHETAVIVRGLIDHTERETDVAKRHARNVSAFVRTAEGSIVGGVNAVLVWGWMHVKEVWVEAAARRQGIGTRILKAAEHEAKEQGCHHAMLDTFDFQARPFYERLGYQCWGELGDFPVGHRRFFMAKALL